MDSPSRNPLLSRDDVSSSEDENESQENFHETVLERNNYIATSHSTASNSKESHKKRTQTAPVDQYNFAYIVFYIIGM